VDDSGGADFTAIQTAVNVASRNDIIIVKDGVYSETVTVDKSLTIRSENGPETTSITAANEAQSIFVIQASNVSVEGLSLIGYERTGCGIKLDGAYEYGTFINNTMSNLWTGIHVCNTNNSGILELGNHRIANNVITSSGASNGIVTIDSSHNTIVNNYIGNIGPFAHMMTGITLSVDVAREDAIQSGKNNTVSGNIVEGCQDGIYLQNVSDNRLYNNTISDYSDLGINFQGWNNSPNKNNIFYLNNIVSNMGIPITIGGDYTLTNYCYSRSPVNYYYNGVLQTDYAGNYWGNSYTGSDPDENGLGYEPYRTRMDPNEYDCFPLMFPASGYLQPDLNPAAEFTSDRQSGIAPLTVNFLNLSTGSVPLSYEWDFGDGSSVSTGKDPSHTYTGSGTYTVKLTATNSAGTDVKVKTGYIVVEGALADFTSDKQLGHAPLTVKFTDQSIGTDLTYAWDFKNDGSATSTEKAPSYTYTEPGTYSVKLIVTSAMGSDELVKTDYITALPDGLWVVDCNGEGDFTTIQEAIDTALAGETIIVRDGSYPENVHVNKSLTLRSENLHSAIINPESGVVVDIDVSNVNIDGFTLTISGDNNNNSKGIYLGAKSNCILTNNQISNVSYGFILGDSNVSCGNNTISGNTISLNNTGVYGLQLSCSINNSITDNTFSDPYGRDTRGIFLEKNAETLDCTQNTISGNTIDSFRHGIYLRAAFSNNIFRNTISNTHANATLNAITLEGISGFGMPSTMATANTFYLNSILGSTTAVNIIGSPESSGNLWNSTSDINYSYNGDQFRGREGNYWEGFSGTDANSDGISETAYRTRSSPDEFDNYPLMSPAAGYTLLYKITAGAGANGSIDPSGDVLVEEGADQSFTIIPDPHYHINDVLVDGISAGAVGSYQFTTITSDHTIAASFAIDTFTITASASAGGSIAPSGEVTVNYGADQTFTITSASGYHVSSVRVDRIHIGAVKKYTFSGVAADHTIAASFNANSSGGSGGYYSGITTPTPTPSPSPTPQPGTTYLGNKVDRSGRFTADVTAASADGRAIVAVKALVSGHTVSGEPLTEITVVPASNPGGIPANFKAGGIYYDIGPGGARFDADILITLPYLSGMIDPFIAFYNSNRGQWELLTTVSIDTVNHTVTSMVDHFSVFGVFALDKAPAVSPTPPGPVSTPQPPTGTVKPAETTAASGQPSATNAAPAPTLPYSEPEPVSPANWPLIIGIIVAVVIVALILFVVLRRRKAVK
jgi:parallel beta-helix repeat protein